MRELGSEALLVPELYTGGIGAMSADKMDRTIRTTVEAYGLGKTPAAAEVYTNAMLPGIFPRKT